MNEYKNSEVIQYNSNGAWLNGLYVGVLPSGRDDHVIIDSYGQITTRLTCNIRKPKAKRTGWIIIYKGHERNYPSVNIYLSKEEAKEWACSNVVDIVKIEWEE